MPRPDTNKYVAKQVLVTVFWGMPLVAVGLFLCATLIGLPLGLACFVLAGLPGAKMELNRTPVVFGDEDPGRAQGSEVDLT